MRAEHLRLEHSCMGASSRPTRASLLLLNCFIAYLAGRFSPLALPRCRRASQRCCDSLSSVCQKAVVGLTPCTLRCDTLCKALHSALLRPCPLLLSGQPPLLLPICHRGARCLCLLPLPAPAAAVPYGRRPASGRAAGSDGPQLSIRVWRILQPSKAPHHVDHWRFGGGVGRWAGVSWRGRQACQQALSRVLPTANRFAANYTSAQRPVKPAKAIVSVGLLEQRQTEPCPIHCAPPLVSKSGSSCSSRAAAASKKSVPAGGEASRQEGWSRRRRKPPSASASGFMTIQLAARPAKPGSLRSACAWHQTCCKAGAAH